MHFVVQPLAHIALPISPLESTLFNKNWVLSLPTQPSSYLQGRHHMSFHLTIRIFLYQISYHICTTLWIEFHQATSLNHFHVVDHLPIPQCTSIHSNLWRCPSHWLCHPAIFLRKYCRWSSLVSQCHPSCHSSTPQCRYSHHPKFKDLDPLSRILSGNLRKI